MHVYFFLKQMDEFVDLFILEEWQKVLDKEKFVFKIVLRPG